MPSLCAYQISITQPSPKFGHPTGTTNQNIQSSNMVGKIDCYIDIGKCQVSRGQVQDVRVLLLTCALSASFYSYIGFVYLVENLKTLEAHGVQVE